MADKVFFCSFCGKSQHEVYKLIAGPTVFICDECTELCMDIVGPKDTMNGEEEYLSWNLTPPIFKLSRIQRAFSHWFEAAASRFAIPLVIERQSKRCQTMVLQNPTWPITVWLRRIGGSHEITIPIVWDHYVWDFLYCNDMVTTKKVPGGFICRHCLPAAQKVFPSKEALWRDHLFEPFLEWVNEKLATSSAIGLYGERHHTTWARLLPREGVEDVPQYRIPITVMP